MLQAYLNIIYFGRGAYGISAASKAYFKPVDQLTVTDGALLAALIQRPSRLLDPAVDLPGAKHRWNWVLDGMVDDHALSPKQTGAANSFRRRCRPIRPARKTRSADPTG